MGIDLASVWAIVILFGIMMYVMLDGFDLGVGILYTFIRDDGERDTMMHSVAPVWDGNETWLVLGGAGLLAAFPLAYSVILSAFMLPLILMLLGLILRGVAFELRFNSGDKGRLWWGRAFTVGSILAAFCQGIVLGSLIDGIEIVDGAYVGSAFGWITPFSMFTGAGLVVAYSLTGCTWLIMKTDGSLRDHMYALVRPLTLLLLATMIVISIWTPLAHSEIAQRWFSAPNILWLSPVPVLVLLVMWRLLKVAKRGRSNAEPFFLGLALILLGYVGLGIGIWPYIIPPSISIWDASGPAKSQGFALVGALVIIPIILAYTAWSYYVFRGKVQTSEEFN